VRRGPLRAIRFGLPAVLAVVVAAPAAAQAPNAPPYPPPLTYSTAPPTKGALATDGPDGRYLLGGTWLYRADVGDVGVSQGWWRGTSPISAWTPVTIPNSYNTGDYSSASMAGYVGWYRRDFTLPANAFASYVPASERRWLIEFESVNYTATVWLNGHLLGTHAGAFLPFDLTLSGLRAGVNHLVVRVDNARTGGDFPPGPSGGWWNFGGILDVVYLRTVQQVDLDNVIIRPILPCPTGCAAKVQESATVQNLSDRPAVVTLKGSFGGKAVRFGSTRIPARSSWSASATVTIPHPKLWAPGSPNLYPARLTVTTTKHRALAGYSYLSGIRSIVRTADGRLELNGRLLDLRGVSLHEQNIATGGAMTVAQQAQLLSWVQGLGATLIRAHYPLDPELEEMADKAGVLLWSEIPVYQVGSQYYGRSSWRKAALALLANNIATNQNHPSILLWSIGNELQTPATTAEGVYISAAVSLAHSLDPTRPVGMAVSDWPGVSCQTAYAPLDVIGVNEYFGWFDAGGGSTDDADALSPFLDSVRACYPDQALMISEFGFDGDRNGPVEARGTYQFQDSAIAFHLGVFASKPWLSGAIYFNLQDFAARPGYDGSNPIGTPPFVTNGLLDTSGNEKPAYALVQSLYRATVQIATNARAGPGG
jgi:beta-glucuronidase